MSTQTQLPPTTWWTTLHDGMVALRAAATEARRAYRSVQLAMADAHPDRLRLEDGTVRVPGTVPGRMVPRRPHDHALTALRDVYFDAESRLDRLYGQTAMAYAYGVTWVAQQLLDGRTPTQIEVPIDHYGTPPSALPVLGEGLAGWDGLAELERLRARYEECVRADELGEELATADYVTEQQAAAMHAAFATARGMWDAAYDYAAAAEGAVDHAYRRAAA
ncbi:hypothetical protein ABVG11_34375 [Streptomyces sp. HD1123-B1]|uniref:hypothetical protein n=1 Tax=Streptomyces huangiella TaxID=3228804 RepID=UPI003D7C3E4B